MLLQSISFGAILLWIVIGAYVRHEPAPKTEQLVIGKGSTRHLLSFSDGLPAENVSQKYCETVDITYRGSGTAVDLEDDEVCSP